MVAALTSGLFACKSSSPSTDRTGIRASTRRPDCTTRVRMRMARRSPPARTQLKPDPAVSTRSWPSKFINCLMYDGKKSVAQAVVLRRDGHHQGEDARTRRRSTSSHRAVENVKPCDRSPLEARRRCHLPGADAGQSQAAADAGDPLDPGGRPRQEGPADRTVKLADELMAAYKPRRHRHDDRAKTSTAWPTPTRRSPTSRGNPSHQARRRHRRRAARESQLALLLYSMTARSGFLIRGCRSHASRSLTGPPNDVSMATSHRPASATSASSPTSTPARRRPPSASCTTPAHPTDGRRRRRQRRTTDFDPEEAAARHHDLFGRRHLPVEGLARST